MLLMSAATKPESMSNLLKSKAEGKQMVLAKIDGRAKTTKQKRPPSQFELQEAAQSKLIRKIHAGAIRTINNSFKGAKEEYEKQAAIEACLKLGYHDLGISLMEII